MNTLKASKAEKVLWSRKLVSFKILLGILELWQEKAGEGVGWGNGVRGLGRACCALTRPAQDSWWHCEQVGLVGHCLALGNKPRWSPSLWHGQHG